MTRYRCTECKCDNPSCWGAWIFWMIGFLGAAALIVVGFAQVPVTDTGGDTQSLLKAMPELGYFGIAPIVGGIFGFVFDTGIFGYMMCPQRWSSNTWFIGYSFCAMLFLLVGGILALVIGGNSKISVLLYSVLFELGATAFVVSCMCSITEVEATIKDTTEEYQAEAIIGDAATDEAQEPPLLDEGDLTAAVVEGDKADDVKTDEDQATEPAARSSLSAAVVQEPPKAGNEDTTEESQESSDWAVESKEPVAEDLQENLFCLKCNHPMPEGESKMSECVNPSPSGCLSKYTGYESYLRGWYTRALTVRRRLAHFGLLPARH